LSASSTTGALAAFEPPPDARAKKFMPKPPFGVSVVAEDAVKSTAGEAQQPAQPRYPIPARPLKKPMDHWDMIVAFDAHKHRQEYTAYQTLKKAAKMQSFKKTLDDQMQEVNAGRDEDLRMRHQERDHMFATLEANRQHKAAEEARENDKRSALKNDNMMMMGEMQQRRQREKDKKARDAQRMKEYLENERRQKEEDDKALAIVHAEKCRKAREEMLQAQEEGARRRRKQQEAEKTYILQQQKSMDDAVAVGRAAVKARMDQIERNCSTLGAEIAGRDAKAERELQEKIRKVQEESDRAAKEDAERRQAEMQRKNKEMLLSLDEQCKERVKDAARRKEEDHEQARMFKEDYERGLAQDRAKAEKRKKAREDQDVSLINQMRAQLQVHPRNFLNTEASQKQDVGYNRFLFEAMHSEGFMQNEAGTVLSPVRAQRAAREAAEADAAAALLAAA